MLVAIICERSYSAAPGILSGYRHCIQEKKIISETGEGKIVIYLEEIENFFVSEDDINGVF